MSSYAPKHAENVYRAARLKAAKYNEKLLTMVSAAECLPGVTEERLKRYENGFTRPPNDVVALMADAYNAPELRCWYCSHECPLGADRREVPDMPPERAVIRMQNVQDDIETAMTKLAVILDDGLIDEEEEMQLLDVKKSMLEARRRMDEVLAIVEKAEGSK